MDSPCIKQTVCKVLKIFQYGKYLVAYVLKQTNYIRLRDIWSEAKKTSLWSYVYSRWYDKAVLIE